MVGEELTPLDPTLLWTELTELELLGGDTVQVFPPPTASTAISAALSAVL